MGISKSGLFGFRVVADGRRGIGLYGESEVGTSYAIHELGTGGLMGPPVLYREP